MSIQKQENLKKAFDHMKKKVSFGAAWVLSGITGLGSERMI